MKRVLSLTFIILFWVCYANLGAQIDIDFGATYKYLKGNEASNLPSNWYESAYSVEEWSEGETPFWYGDGVGGSELLDMQNTYSSFYLRKAFSANNVERISKLQLSIDYDDGFVLWINGIEKMRVLAPSDLSSGGFASDNHESGTIESYELSVSEGELIEGENVIALQVFNVSLESSDVHMNLALSASLDLPSFADSLQVSFSHESDFYDTPFYVSLTAEVDSLDVYYTLDGSHPGYSTSAVNLGSAGTVLIDPDDLNGRANTPAVVLRAALMSPGYKPSYPQSRTFIFQDKILYQSYPGGDWPNTNVNDQLIDLGVDTRISVGSAYADRMELAFKSIPSMSIVTDNASLFDASIGIYVNAWGHGELWERECSVELFDDDSVLFYANAGLRIRGGWSRHNYFPKHSFRLFFRSEYGDSKLDYPLFQEEGTDKYDKIDLRTSQNYAWSRGDSRNTMLREVFSRDLQRDMGQPHTRSRYYHLYLNGMYWGVYQTQERSEARFATSYFGGDDEDYDIIKVDTEDWAYRIEATDGNVDKWQEIYSMTEQGFSELESYYEIQGLDESGRPSRELESLVDIDNLIDYMIGIFYAGNFDSPTSAFHQNNICNNFFAIKDRTDPTQGFRFFNHDAEHSLFSDAANPGIGIEEDRVNLGTRTDNMRMEVASFDVFHPQWLHFKLCENEEYLVRFSDRAYQCLKPDGFLSEDISLARFDKRMDELDPAIIAESARWGDAKTSESLNRDDHWIPEVNKVRDDFFRLRPEILIDQFQMADLYPTIEGPDFYIDQKYTIDEAVSFNESAILKVEKPASTGSLCYTLDGSDPRQVGGDIASSSVFSNSSFNLAITQTTEVQVRVLDGDTWSALRKIKILKEDEDYSGMKITEINYNPLDSLFGTDTIAGKSFEFLEFKNIGEHAINLSGLSLDSAISYSFPENEILHPNDFYVVSSKTVDFFQRYGRYTSGNYKGFLSNSGERILLMDPYGDELMSVMYGISYPWTPFANGFGYTLVPKYSSPESDPADAAYWLASSNKGGSPFMDDGASSTSNIVDEVISTFTLYPNPTSEYIIVRQTEGDSRQALEMNIMDINGRILFASTYVSGERIELKALGLSAGVYFVRLKDGLNISNHKFIFVPE